MDLAEAAAAVLACWDLWLQEPQAGREHELFCALNRAIQRLRQETARVETETGSNE